MANYKFNTKVQLLVIVLVTFGVYANSLFNGFVWDDQVFIKEWQIVRSFKGLPYILKGAYPASDTGKYRPVKGIILTLDNQLFGPNPFYHHLQGIFIHLVTTLMVYVVVEKLIKLIEADYTDSVKKWLPFITALIFGVHPVHVEAITFITSSTDMIGVTFLLASFYFYLKQEEFGRRLTGNFWLALIFAFLAYVSNEVTLILPLFLILYDLCFKHDFKVPVKFYAPFFVLAGGLVLTRYFVLNIGSYTGGYFAGSFITNMLLMPKVIVIYLQLLFWPVNLNVNHEILDGNLALRFVDFDPQLAEKVMISNPQVYLSTILVVLISVLGFIVWKKWPIITFLIGWFFIAIIPVANIIPINILLAERYIYLASLAFCLGLALFFSKILGVQLLSNPLDRNGIETGQKARSRSRFVQLGVIVSLILIIIFYSTVTILRNLDWKDEKSLWLKTVQQVPGSVIANNDLGVAYLGLNENELALKHLEKALEITHVYFGKMSISSAKAYLRLDQPDKAIVQLNRAIAQSPENWSGYAYLGEAYVKLGKLTKAIENYKISIANNPQYYDARIELANVYTEQQKYERALEQLNIAKRINPYLSATYNNIALIYYKEKKIEEAIAELKRGLKITGDQKLNANLQKIKGKEEPVEEAVVTLGD